MRAVLDTNILIDHLNGVSEAKLEIGRYSQPMISAITWMEVMAGAMSDDERLSLRQFLANFECVAISQAVMERAARLRAESRLRLPDAIVLASALCTNLILVTRNTKDFNSAIWPNVRVPYSI